MEPLLFKPLIRQIRWGGRRLGRVLQKEIGDAADYAESWEIADQPEARSVVASGPHAGESLQQLMTQQNGRLMGRHADLKQFPLLIKFLDANDWLSLQVHPNDQQAIRFTPDENGKTEAWVIVDAEPDAQICAGLRSGVTAEAFLSHLQNGTVEETLHMIPARTGDCVFVPAQTVHALGPGILVAEVQQQSNLTFRLHDWGRMGSNGKPRQLHIDESIECIDFERGPVNPVVPTPLSDGNHNFEELVRCEYFVIRRHTSVDSFAIRMDDRFRILMMLEGSAQVQSETGTVEIKKGTTTLLPASLSSVSVQPQGKTTLLEILYP